MNRDHSQKRGLALVELLVVLGTASLIAVVGMKLIHFSLSRLTESQVRQLEVQAVQDLCLRLQMAWDQRLEPFTPEDPWLEIETWETVTGNALNRLRIRCLGSRGRIQRLELTRTGDNWTLSSWPEDGTWEPTLEHPIRYAGEILINSSGGRFFRNEKPGVLYLQFPEAEDRVLRQGIAIHTYW
ncbi:MAG: hypothetical protein AB3N64_12855 [Puniceicoccaceae bacterium]